MLSGANLQSNFQQQQTMVQYLQQQQYLQQNFPHQQLSMPGQQPPSFPSSVPLQQPPQMQMQAQQAQMQPHYHAPQQVQQPPAVSYAPPHQSHSQMMDSINTLAASIMQPQSYNTSQAPAQAHRPAPVHYGAPLYPVPSAQVYETTNDAEFLRQSVPPSPVTVPVVSPTPAPLPVPIYVPAPVPAPAPEPVYVREPTPIQAPPTPQIVTEEPPAVQESSRRSSSPKERSHRKEKRHRDKSKEREKDRDRERDHSRERDPPSVSKSGSDDSKHHGQHDPSVMLTGRSTMDNSFNYGAQTGRLGTGQTAAATPGSSNQNGAAMPANRIMRKGQQSNAASFADSNDLAAANVLASGVNGAHGQNGHSQHAFMANLLSKQAQHGKFILLK